MERESAPAHLKEAAKALKFASENLERSEGKGESGAWATVDIAIQWAIEARQAAQAQPPKQE